MDDSSDYNVLWIDRQEASSGANNQHNLLITALSSATAGLVGRLICHPIDTVKSKLQASDSLLSIRHTVRSTINQEGLIGLYRGLGGVLVGGVPGVALYISSYELSKDYLTQFNYNGQKPFQNNEFSVYMVSGLVAEASW